MREPAPTAALVDRAPGVGGEEVRQRLEQAERGQPRPATAEERTSGAVFIGGTTLAVRS